ncbi:MAG TPA: hypothetical protein VKS24_24835 [Bradyrhizobium sp.]|nr:hypothetical protein [Bradyrhizobium sp.]
MAIMILTGDTYEYRQLLSKHGGWRYEDFCGRWQSHPYIAGAMNPHMLSLWLEAEWDNMLSGRSNLGFYRQCERDVEVAKSAARVWTSVYARLFQ